MAKKLLSSCLPVKSATGIVHEVAAKVVSVLVGDFKACVVAEGRFRLIAADQFRKANDCCVPKQSLQVAGSMETYWKDLADSKLKCNT